MATTLLALLLSALSSGQDLEIHVVSDALERDCHALVEEYRVPARDLVHVAALAECNPGSEPDARCYGITFRSSGHKAVYRQVPAWAICNVVADIDCAYVGYPALMPTECR